MPIVKQTAHKPSLNLISKCIEEKNKNLKAYFFIPHPPHLLQLLPSAPAPAPAPASASDASDAPVSASTFSTKLGKV